MFRLILVALVLVIASPARAHLHLTADEPQASLVWWRPSVEGSLGVQVGNASAGAKYSDDHPSSFGATASLRTFGAVCLDLDYTPINTDAKVVSSAAFTFHDKTFSATGNGHLNYAMPVLGVGLRYLVLERKRGNLGVIGTVKVVMPNVKLSVGSATAAADLVIPVPMAGLSGQLNFGAWAHAFGSYKLLHLDIAAVDARIEDWETGLCVDHNPPDRIGFRAAAGYRKLDIDIATGGGGDLKLSTRRGGPFLELALVF